MNRKHGLTIVELSILVAIAMLVVAISLPAVLQNRQKRHAASCARNLDALSAACRRYAAEQGGFPARPDVLVPAYLPAVPVCPDGGAYQLGTPEGDPPACSVPGHLM
ncbi:MAG TPA: hypothetical protein PKU89_08815 [Kiritimatiellia bacterium]|nr:hypothetical protein [Kiritimatiellia bacterium]